MSELFGYLFARPSFIEGVARIFDFGSTLEQYNESSNPSLADYRAIYDDVRVIGYDLWLAMQQYGETAEQGAPQIK